MYVNSTHSTNSLLAELIKSDSVGDGYYVYTHEQTAGRGQQGNVWMSEPGRNLLMSMLYVPEGLPIARQFVISQMIAVAIKRVLDKYVTGISVKWPNDIYWRDRKIAGILIENALVGPYVKHSIVGVGLNVNQVSFCDSLPNPVSLRSITGLAFDLEKIRKEILDMFEVLKHCCSNESNLRVEYFDAMYRKEGFHPYSENGERFMAQIVDVELDGRLVLRKEDGTLCYYYFKEVAFLND